jgi:crotonobetainyl-CoA:carnitine CoA-transferase CaiB-like acyl-CoA transferase
LQYQPVLAADGQWIQLGNLIEHLFHSFIAAAELGDIYADPRFANAPHLEADAREALRDVILTRMRERPSAEWMERFIANGNVAAEPVTNTQTALDHAQLRMNGDVLEFETSAHGRIVELGPIAALRETPAAICPEVPAIGEHNLTLPERWRTAAPNLAESAGAAETGSAPLARVTVVELATIIAAPLACSILGDLGARVIKIETPPDGDPLRFLGNGVSAIKTTASKESICVDLKQPEGQAIARAIIEGADVLVHNFRPGVPERLGFGFDQITRRNPGLIYVSAMGYGVAGPHAHRPSAHPIPGAAMGGALWQVGSGWPESVETLDDVREAARQFTRANEVNPDPTTSMAIATAALLGLAARRRTGRGQAVDLNMFIANGYANWDDALSYDGKPKRQLVDPDLRGVGAGYRLYEAAEGWVFLAFSSDGEWSALCDTAGWQDLGEEAQFASKDGRERHDEALAAVLEERFKARTADEWEALLASRGIGCVRADGPPPGSFWDADAHVRANAFTVAVDHPLWGAMQRHGPVVTFSESAVTPGPGTIAGQHTLAILGDLGYGQGEVEALLARGVIAARGADGQRYTGVDALTSGP